MTGAKQSSILIALTVASGILATFVPFSIQAILIILGITFAASLISTALVPIRHDLITIAVGLSSAVVVVVKEPGPFSPIVFVIFLAVPYIGAAIGRDFRGFQRRKNKGQQQPELYRESPVAYHETLGSTFHEKE